MANCHESEASSSRVTERHRQQGGRNPESRQGIGRQESAAEGRDRCAGSSRNHRFFAAGQLDVEGGWLSSEPAPQCGTCDLGQAANRLVGSSFRTPHGG
jgi:hypothetical protein